MAERNLFVDHVTIWRWVQRYAPVLNQRIRREMRSPNRSWRVHFRYPTHAYDLTLCMCAERPQTCDVYHTHIRRR